MICKKCGTEYDGAFCPKCGERTEEKLTVCPVCGKVRAEGENFCVKCGYAFEGQASETQKRQLKITFDKEALLNGVKKFYKVALNIGKVFFSLLIFLILASPIMLHEGINTAGSGYTNAFNLYVDGRFTAVCAILMIIAFYSFIYGLYALVKFFVFHNRKESKSGIIIYFAASFLVFIVCCTGCSGAGEWFADAGAGLSFGIFVGIVGMALSVLRFLFEDKFVNSDGVQSVEVSDDVKAVEKKATKKVGLGTAIVTGALVIAVVITSIVQSVYTNPFSSVSYGFAETRADVIKQFGMPENAKADSSSYTYYSTEYIAAERMINKLIEAQDKKLTDGFESDADSFDEDDFESMLSGTAGIDAIIEKLEEKKENEIYKKTTVVFNSDGEQDRNEDTVKSYVCEVISPEVEGEEKKERTLKKIDVIEGVYEEYGYSAQIKYVAKYSDGSFSGDILTLNSDNYDKNKKEYKFSDALGEYSVSIKKLNKMEFNSDGAAAIGNTLYISKNYNGGGEIRPEGDYSDKDITRIVILQGVTSVSGKDAFDAFTNVMEIIVPDSLTYLNPKAIKNTALYNDPSNWDNDILYVDNLLVEIKNDINDYFTVKNGTTAINESAFSGMTNLKTIIIPDSMTRVGNNAFINCTSLEKVYIKDITDWCNIAFGNLYSNPLHYAKMLYLNNMPIADLVIPDGVTSIGNYAFDGCSLLTSITIPDSVTSIGNYAFDGCSSLTSITIPDSVTSIGNYAFYGCSSLTSVTIPSSVTSIGFSAFSGCHMLKNVKFDENSNLKSINRNTFEDCRQIKSINIPDSVTSIDSHAFSGCYKLESVKFAENSKLKSIEGYAFEDCSQITNITIPDSVTSIGNYAFSGCSSLLSITISNSVINIGDYVFSGCYMLKNVKFDENSKLKNIGRNAFEDCRQLASIVMPDSLTVIDNYVFSGCNSLVSISMPDSLTFIGDYAFSECSALLSIAIPNSVSFIGDYAFSGCSSLTSITIPNSVTSIYYGAFWGCDSLTSVRFENTQGWWYSSSSLATSGTSISSSSLANPTTAAWYLRSTYNNYYWKRG